MPDKPMTVTIKQGAYSVTITIPAPSGGLWEARKRIEAAMQTAGKS